MEVKQNANPTIHSCVNVSRREILQSDWDETEVEPFDTLEVFDHIRHLNDPEHPLTLEQLKVVRLEDISVDNKRERVKILFTPTVPHCSMAKLIGLCIKEKLRRSLPTRLKVLQCAMWTTHECTGRWRNNILDWVDGETMS